MPVRVLFYRGECPAAGSTTLLAQTAAVLGL